VEDLPKRQTYPEWQRAFFGATNAPAATENADPDQDGALNSLEYLTGRNPLDGTDAWKIEIQKTGDLIQILVPQTANRLFELQFTEALTPGVAAIECLATARSQRLEPCGVISIPRQTV